MNIVFENQSFIAVDKPHGWLTTPARLSTDPRPCLGRKLQDERGQQIYPVHRLDFEVSGLVLFALGKEAHTRAQQWFETGDVLKTYQAYSKGSAAVLGEWEEWRSKLVRGKRRTFEASHGKESRTRARIVESKDGRLKWELQPLTGRPHQLRFEMSKHHAPILGDTLYGAGPSQSEGIALRAVCLDFTRCKDRHGLPDRIEVNGLIWEPA